MVLFLVMAIIFVTMVGAAIRHAFQGHFRDNIRPHITQYLEYVQADIGSPPDPIRAAQLARRLNIEIQIIDRSGPWSSSGHLTNIDNVEIERDFVINGNQFFHMEANGQHYLMARDGDSTLLFNVPNLREQRGGFRGWIPLLILLILLMVLYHATRRLFAPLDKIRQGVDKFGTGDVEHRIQISRKDELGELADSFNAMADDIQQMLDAKRQLLLAISHELRSPLTRARVAAEILQESDEKMQIIQDINAMESLIEELTETERLSSRHSVLNRSRQNIVELVHDTIRTNFEGAAIGLDITENEMMVECDAARIRLLVKKPARQCIAVYTGGCITAFYTAGNR